MEDFQYSADLSLCNKGNAEIRNKRLFIKNRRSQIIRLSMLEIRYMNGFSLQCGETSVALPKTQMGILQRFRTETDASCKFKEPALMIEQQYGSSIHIQPSSNMT